MRTVVSWADDSFIRPLFFKTRVLLRENATTSSRSRKINVISQSYVFLCCGEKKIFKVGGHVRTGLMHAHHSTETNNAIHEEYAHCSVQRALFCDASSVYIRFTCLLGGRPVGALFIARHILPADSQLLAGTISDVC